MDITPLIPVEHVAVGVQAIDKRSIIQSVARLTAQVEDSIDEQALVAALLQREALGTTGLGRGIAVPHATLPGLRKTVITIMRLAEPVEYGSSDGEQVAVVFSLVSGKEHQHDQLRALARIARLAMRHNLATELRGLDTPVEVRDRLQVLEEGLNQQ